ncbi:DUF4188 domain-containing protein [Gordonia insulae]
MTNVAPPEGTTLFLIGMRVTKPWRVRAWVGVFAAMARILGHLRANRGAGMLSHRLYLGSSAMVVSYWSSADDLRRFAAAADAPHLPAWRWFTRNFADTNSVGIWHETYVIGEHETISSGMGAWGLAEAVGAEPIGSGQATAAARLAHNGCPAARRVP